MPCNSRCTHAKGDLCRCSCEGANHGIYAHEEDLEENKEENENEENEFKKGDIVLDMKKRHEEFLERKKNRRAEIERNKPSQPQVAESKSKLRKAKAYRKVKDSTFRREQKEKIPQQKITDFGEDQDE